ncbi:MAG: Ig domain-containing protein [Lachnospiraceae bacterium]|nr:Ig domain-containing protein [Lachnospiraceae bacterium]
MIRKDRKAVIMRTASMFLAVSLFVTAQEIPVSAETVSENTMEQLEEAEETVQLQQEVWEDLAADAVRGDSVSIDSVRSAGKMPALPIHHCEKETGIQDYTEWDYVYFGSYPQSEVMDEAVIAAIEDSIPVSGILTDGGMDVWVDGVKYRRISSKYMNNSVSAKQRFSDCTYRYFKWERIKWKVLAIDEDSLFVVADKALDNKSYHDTKESITWENCTLRSWLNEEFYHTAFDRNEQSAIEEQDVENEDNPLVSVDGGNQTTDKVYLLSMSEVTDSDYGFCKFYNMDIEEDYGWSRKTDISDYAYVRGAMRSSSGSDQDSGHWWLRSPGNASNKAVRVGPGGYLYKGAGAYVSMMEYAVCPALHIKVSSDLWYLEDDGGSGTGGEGGESLPNEWMEGIAPEECRIVVYDKETKERIPDASVTIDGKSYPCDGQGYVRLKPDEVQTRFSHFVVTALKEGYETSILKLGKEQIAGGEVVYLGLKKKTEVIYRLEELESCDKENARITIGGEVYDLAEDFAADIPEAILKNGSGQKVVCTLVNGKIARVEALKDIIKPAITVYAKEGQDNKLLYINGAYQGGNEADCIVRISCVAGNYPDALFSHMDSSEKQKYGINLSTLEWSVEKAAPINFYGQFVRKMNYGNRKLFLGDSLEREIAYQADDGIPSKRLNKIYQIEAVITASSIKEEAATADNLVAKGIYEVPVLNMDLLREKHNDKKEDPDSAAVIRNSIEEKARQELEGLCSQTTLSIHIQLKEYFSEEEIEKIEGFLYTWLTALEVCGQIDYSKKEESMTAERRAEVLQSVFRQLGIKEDGNQTENTGMTASKILEATGQDGQKVQIEFLVSVNSASDGKWTCSWEEVQYDILTGYHPELSMPCSGSVDMAAADTKELSENMKLLAESVLKETYDCNWNETAEQTAMLFTSEALQNIMDLKTGSFSNPVFRLESTLVKESLKKVEIQGPVDVYLYDMSGNLCGVIQDNTVDESHQEAVMLVEGDRKILYLTNEDYKIQLIGNATGSVEYSLTEYDDSMNELRSLQFQPLPVSRGDAYGGVVLEPVYAAKDLYALFEEKGEDVVYPDTDTYEDALEEPVDTVGVSLDITEKSLMVGEFLQLKASVLPANAANQYVTWESSNEAIVFVDSEGKAIARKPGDAIVKVVTRKGKFESTCKITVKSSEAESNAEESKAEESGAAEGGAAEGGAEESDDTVEGNQNVASDSRKEVKVTKISIAGLSKKLAAGKKVKLTLKVMPENASDKSVAWSTSNKKYATVDKNGKVTIKKAGIGKTVTITATAQDGSKVKATYKFKIMKHAVKSIRLKASAKTLKAGKSMTIKTTIKTTGKSVNKTLKWTSSNTRYATVSKKGRVTAKKAGKGKTVTITAASTDGSNKKAKVKIKIK